MPYYITVLLTFLSSFLVGCATSDTVQDNIRVEDIYLLNYEERDELRTLLEEYSEKLRSPDKDQQEYAEVQRSIPEGAPEILSGGGALSVSLCEQDRPGFLSKIREIYELTISQTPGCSIHLVDTKKFDNFYELNMSSSQLLPGLFGGNKRRKQPQGYTSGGNWSGSISGNYIKGYIHYVQKDGQEKRVTIADTEALILNSSHARSITRIEPDGKTLTVEYSIKLWFPRDGCEPLIKGETKVATFSKVDSDGEKEIRKENKLATINEKIMCRYEYQGKITVPEGKTVVIEYGPTGNDLTEKELRKKQYLWFINVAVAK